MKLNYPLAYKVFLVFFSVKMFDRHVPLIIKHFKAPKLTT